MLPALHNQFSRDGSVMRKSSAKQCSILAAAVAAIMPTRGLRVWAYRVLCGYQITRGAAIGFGTLIAVRHAEIGCASIGRFNRFRGPFDLTIGDAARIGSRNTIVCGDLEYERFCHIGPHTLITSGHYFDVVGGFTLSEYAWIAGFGSQFWTHGLGTTERSVTIGSNTYVGSAVRFAPGAAVGENCVVAMGSVVTSRLAESDVLIGGVPARILRDNAEWREQLPREAAQRRAGGAPA